MQIKPTRVELTTHSKPSKEEQENAAHRARETKFMDEAEQEGVRFADVVEVGAEEAAQHGFYEDAEGGLWFSEEDANFAERNSEE